MLKRYHLILYILILSCILFCGCSQDENIKKAEIPEQVFIYAENQPSAHPASQGAYKFSELVEKRTNGRIQIQVEPNASLGNEDEIIEQLQFGGIDFTRASLASMSDFMPKLNVLYMPFLYQNSEHEWAVLDGQIGESFLKDFQEQNLIGLSWYDAGARSLYTAETPVTCLEDLRNMNIRTIDSSLMKDLLLALGANPVAMQFKDVYSAMGTGQVDGAENNLPSYEASEHYKIARYYTFTEHLRIPEVQLCSLRTWKRLSKSDQKIIRECAYQSALYERELWKLQEDQIKAHFSEYGITEIHLSETELARFHTAAEPLYEKYCSEYLDLLNDIKYTKSKP